MPKVTKTKTKTKKPRKSTKKVTNNVFFDKVIRGFSKLLEPSK